MSSPAKILLVDDDVVIHYMIEDITRQMGHSITCVADGAGGRAALKDDHFDLVILDRRLPDTDGLLLAPDIQADPRSSFIVLSSLATPNDQLLGLGLGALDYVTKPVEPAVLKARMERHLATRRDTLGPATLSIGKTFHLNPVTRRLTVAGRTECLSPAECRLLAHFMQNIDIPQSRSDISKAIGGREWVYGDRTGDVLVSRIRKRIAGSMLQIITVHGLGYSLTAEPAERFGS
ncbi:response regulator transcription factor [Rhodopseudomonas palustris]|uniref:response regulator transcription factor n=1 Tax=Rhodopseudomonas palustris TaxID=1076 RepID=UPI0020CCA7B5|nr:response regulator transcription factor [Rhodopseudomonas palustris]MCP9629051.1 response regulator transcription factor [Rhodopseudomonas palustris]